MSSDLEPVPGDWERALVVVAHPDDIEFGSSGAVAAWTRAGKTVSYLLLSRGEAGIESMAPKEAAEVREREQRASAEIVGVNDVEFLDYPDGLKVPAEKGGGTWARMFVPGSMADVALTPQHWGMYAT